MVACPSSCILSGSSRNGKKTVPLPQPLPSAEGRKHSVVDSSTLPLFGQNSSLHVRLYLLLWKRTLFKKLGNREENEDANSSRGSNCFDSISAHAGTFRVCHGKSPRTRQKPLFPVAFLPLISMPPRSFPFFCRLFWVNREIRDIGKSGRPGGLMKRWIMTGFQRSCPIMRAVSWI